MWNILVFKCFFHIQLLCAYSVPGTVLGSESVNSEHNQQNSTFLEFLYSHHWFGAWDPTQPPLPRLSTMGIPCAVWAGEMPRRTYVFPGEEHLLVQVQPSILPSCQMIQKVKKPRFAFLPFWTRSSSRTRNVSFFYLCLSTSCPKENSWPDYRHFVNVSLNL